MLMLKQRIKDVRHFIEPSNTCQQTNLKKRKTKQSHLTDVLGWRKWILSILMSLESAKFEGREKAALHLKKKVVTTCTILAVRSVQEGVLRQEWIKPWWWGHLDARNVGCKLKRSDCIVMLHRFHSEVGNNFLLFMKTNVETAGRLKRLGQTLLEPRWHFRYQIQCEYWGVFCSEYF